MATHFSRSAKLALINFKQRKTTMNQSKIAYKILAIPVIAAFVTACASTTKIDTTPTGATLYVNGERAGTTPYTYTDTKTVGSSVQLKIKKEGFQDFETTMTRNEEPDTGAIVGGVLTFVPLFWSMKYKPTHTYELVPVAHQIEAPLVPDYSQPVAPAKKGGGKKKR